MLGLKPEFELALSQNPVILWYAIDCYVVCYRDKCPMKILPKRASLEMSPKHKSRLHPSKFFAIKYLDWQDNSNIFEIEGLYPPQILFFYSFVVKLFR